MTPRFLRLELLSAAEVFVQLFDAGLLSVPNGAAARAEP